MRSSFDPFLKRKPHFACSEWIARGHIRAVLLLVFIRRVVRSPIGFSFRPRERVGIDLAEAGLGCMSIDATGQRAFAAGGALCRRRGRVRGAGRRRGREVVG